MTVGAIDLAVSTAARVWELRKELKSLKSEEEALVKELYNLTERVDGVYAFDLVLSDKVDYKGVLASLSAEYGIKPEELSVTIGKHTTTTDYKKLNFAKGYKI